MSVLIRGVKTAICELGRLLKWVESACSVSGSFLNTFSLTSKHLLPAASVDKLPRKHLLANAMFNSPSHRVPALAAGQASKALKGEEKILKAEFQFLTIWVHFHKGRQHFRK